MLKEFLTYLISLSKSGKIDTDVPTILLHDSDQKITDLERYSIQKRRYKATFIAKELEGFYRYINSKQADEGIDIENAFIAIDPENLKAEATFNCTDLGHCDDTASLSLPLTPEYKALLKLKGNSTMGQRDSIEWVEEWNHVLSESTALINALRKIEAKRKSEATSETNNFSESASLMESVEIANTNLPEEILFKCIPSEGLPEITCRLRVKAHLDNLPIHFSLQPIQLDLVEKEVANSFKHYLEENISSGRIHIGQISF